MALVQELPDSSKSTMLAVLASMEPPFWTMMRKEQVVGIYEMTRGTAVTQDDIGKVMNVSQCTVSRYIERHQTHPDDMHPMPGRPSPLPRVFSDIKNFIASEVSAGCSVTMSSGLKYLIDEHDIYVSGKHLWDFLTNQGFPYVEVVPDEERRLRFDREEIMRFYTTTLPQAVNGVHPALFYNMDEMGAERYADRKAVFTFLPQNAPRGANVDLGVKRTSNRCTLVVCIALDGTTLTPAVITKTRTISSRVFESGYSPEKVRFFSTQNSFIVGDVFGDWLKEVFIPHVEETRRTLRQTIGPFDDRAILLLDGCSSHKMAAHAQLLASKNITLLFIPAHSSHLTQPLDLGIFCLVKRLLRREASYALDANLTNNNNQIDLNGDDENSAESLSVESHESGEESTSIDLNDDGVPPPNRAERGLALAEYVLDILDALERSTSRRNVVSAFRQAGIVSRIPDLNDLHRWVTYIDPSFARAVNRKTGLFEGSTPTHVAERKLLKIANMRRMETSRAELENGESEGDAPGAQTNEPENAPRAPFVSSRPPASNTLAAPGRLTQPHTANTLIKSLPVSLPPQRPGRLLSAAALPLRTHSPRPGALPNHTPPTR